MENRDRVARRSTYNNIEKEATLMGTPNKTEKEDGPPVERKAEMEWCYWEMYSPILFSC